jgi:hypothetical protein
MMGIPVFSGVKIKKIGMTISDVNTLLKIVE